MQFVTYIVFVCSCPNICSATSKFTIFFLHVYLLAVIHSNPYTYNAIDVKINDFNISPRFSHFSVCASWKAGGEGREKATCYAEKQRNKIANVNAKQKQKKIDENPYQRPLELLPAAIKNYRQLFRVPKNNLFPPAIVIDSVFQLIYNRFQFAPFKMAQVDI